MDGTSKAAQSNHRVDAEANADPTFLTPAGWLLEVQGSKFKSSSAFAKASADKQLGKQRRKFHQILNINFEGSFWLTDHY